jgi:hypothetical protein
VIADGFLKRERPRGLARWAIDAIARNWAVPGFARVDELRRVLADEGFADIEVEEISWRLALSVLHIRSSPHACWCVTWSSGRRPSAACAGATCWAACWRRSSASCAATSDTS